MLPTTSCGVSEAPCCMAMQIQHGLYLSQRFSRAYYSGKSPVDKTAPCWGNQHFGCPLRLEQL